MLNTLKRQIMNKAKCGGYLCLTLTFMSENRTIKQDKRNANPSPRNSRFV